MSSRKVVVRIYDAEVRGRTRACYKWAEVG